MVPNALRQLHQSNTEHLDLPEDDEEPKPMEKKASLMSSVFGLFDFTSGVSEADSQ